MAEWYVCTMDDGILSEHKTKRGAVEAIPEDSLTPRRLGKGEYEYNTRGDGRGVSNTYYVMTRRGARRNGWEPRLDMVVHDRYGQEIKKGDEIEFRDWARPDVPLHLTGTVGYVEDITRRGKIVVRARSDCYGIRTCWPRYVALYGGDRKAAP